MHSGPIWCHFYVNESKLPGHSIYYKSFQILPINLFLSQISNLYFRIRNNPIPIIRISIQEKSNKQKMEDTNNNQSMISREKLDQAASWVSSTVVSAFFSSLERFSCVNVATSDPEDEEENDTNLPQNDTRTHLQNGTVNVNVQQPNDVTKLPV